ncbi:hypothetical protein LRD69_19600 [Streptomyces sp. JH14]|uniref:hypothetical protein n=1 Tax=Streptomyces sp. JH14 TaxID=2793630 RepID=UPI0023F7F511|nr:hypothetical protein [Streptomyces sp. JH14]MDF6044301.1 hypothetical protein [Streptomyces sp. JH14]
MPDRTAIVRGLSTGTGLVLLVPTGLVILLLVLRSVHVPPEPGGSPLARTRSRLRGPWQDGHGGRLDLAGNGTSGASHLCGDCSDAATGTGSGFGSPSAMTGSGPWAARPVRALSSLHVTDPTPHCVETPATMNP